MSTPIHRLAIALLGLAMIVLPARAWSDVLMHLSGAPCETAAAQPWQGHEGAHAGSPTGERSADIHKACTTCGVCHGAMLPGSVPALDGTPCGTGWRCADVPRPPAGAPAELYRPPRI